MKLLQTLQKQKIIIILLYFSCLVASHSWASLTEEETGVIHSPVASPSSFKDVPLEIKAHVFSFLDPQDLLRVRRVCKLWSQMVTVKCIDVSEKDWEKAKQEKSWGNGSLLLLKLVNVGNTRQQVNLESLVYDPRLVSLNLVRSCVKLEEMKTIFNGKLRFKTFSLVSTALHNFDNITNLVFIDDPSLTVDFNDLIPLFNAANITSLSLHDAYLRWGFFKGGLNTLTSLRVSRCSLSDKDAGFFKNFENLTDLDINSNEIGSQGAASIGKLTKLTSLNASHNSLKDQAVKSISKLPYLKVLELASNEIGNKGAKYISLNKPHTQSVTLLREENEENRIVLSRSNLTYLGLSGNRVKDKGIEFIALNCPYLTGLDLSCNPLSGERLEFISNCTRLTSLKFRNNWIKEGTFLKAFTNLTSLDLRSNQIKDGAFFKALTNLTRLDLGSNQVREGMFLKTLPNLVWLSLKSTQIRNLTVLEDLTNLTHLDLGFNEIRALRFLKNLKNLTHLDLKSNAIGNEVFVEENVRNLKNLTNLIHLDLKSNSIKSEEASGLKKKLLRLTRLDF